MFVHEIDLNLCSNTCNKHTNSKVIRVIRSQWRLKKFVYQFFFFFFRFSRFIHINIFKSIDVRFCCHCSFLLLDFFLFLRIIMIIESVSVQSKEGNNEHESENLKLKFKMMNNAICKSIDVQHNSYNIVEQGHWIKLKSNDKFKRNLDAINVVYILCYWIYWFSGV